MFPSDQQKTLPEKIFSNFVLMNFQGFEKFDKNYSYNCTLDLGTAESKNQNMKAFLGAEWSKRTMSEQMVNAHNLSNHSGNY